MESHETFVNGQGTFAAIRQDFISPPQPPYPYNIHELQEPALFNSNEETGHGVAVGSAAVSKIQYSYEIDGSSFRDENRDHTR